MFIQNLKPAVKSNGNNHTENIHGSNRKKREREKNRRSRDLHWYCTRTRPQDRLTGREDRTKSGLMSAMVQSKKSFVLQVEFLFQTLLVSPTKTKYCHFSDSYTLQVNRPPTLSPTPAPTPPPYDRKPHQQQTDKGDDMLHLSLLIDKSWPGQTFPCATSSVDLYSLTNHCLARLLLVQQVV